MSALNSRSAIDPRWVQWGQRTLAAFESCVVAIYAPNSQNSGDNFDPYNPKLSDTSVPTLLWEGPAQVQVYRQVLTVDDVAGSVAQVRSVRITLPRSSYEMVRKGMVVHVTSCPDNPKMETYEYIVSSGLGSALAFKNVIEAEVDQSVAVRPITEVTP